MTLGDDFVDTLMKRAREGNWDGDYIFGGGRPRTQEAIAEQLRKARNDKGYFPRMNSTKPGEPFAYIFGQPVTIDATLGPDEVRVGDTVYRAMYDDKGYCTEMVPVPGRPALPSHTPRVIQHAPSPSTHMSGGAIDVLSPEQQHDNAQAKRKTEIAIHQKRMGNGNPLRDLVLVEIVEEIQAEIDEADRIENERVASQFRSNEYAILVEQRLWDLGVIKTPDSFVRIGNV